MAKNQTLRFSIDAPKDAITLAKEQAKLEKESSSLNRARLIWKWAAAMLVPMLAVTTHLSPAGGPLGVFLAPWIIGPFGLLLSHLYFVDLEWSVYRRFSDLELLDQHKCTQVLAWCETHPVIAAYQSAVVAERLLVNGDFKAMGSWVCEFDAENASARAAQACARLRTPTSSAQPSGEGMQPA